MPESELITVEVPTREITVPFPELETGTERQAPSTERREDRGTVSDELGQQDLGAVAGPEDSDTIPVAQIDDKTVEITDNVLDAVDQVLPNSFGFQQASFPPPFENFSIPIPTIGAFSEASGEPRGNTRPVSGSDRVRGAESGTATVEIDLNDIPLGSVELPTVEIPVPEIPSLAVEPFRVLSSVSFTGTQTVQVPTGAAPTVSIKFQKLLEAQLPQRLSGLTRDPVGTLTAALTAETNLPPRLLAEPGKFIFQTAFAQLEANVNPQVAKRIKRLVETFLQRLLSEDTKQELRQQRRE